MRLMNLLIHMSKMHWPYFQTAKYFCYTKRSSHNNKGPFLTIIWIEVCYLYDITRNTRYYNKKFNMCWRRPKKMVEFFLRPLIFFVDLRFPIFIKSFKVIMALYIANSLCLITWRVQVYLVTTLVLYNREKGGKNTEGDKPLSSQVSTIFYVSYL